MANRGTAQVRGLNQKVGIAFGAVYLLVGLIGFAVTSGVGFAAKDGDLLLGVFEINPLHNIAHLLIGALLLYAGLRSEAAARGMNLFVGIAYGALGVVGFFIEDSDANILALNQADHWLHLGSALVLILVAMRGRDRRRYS